MYLYINILNSVMHNYYTNRVLHYSTLYFWGAGKHL